MFMANENGGEGEGTGEGEGKPAKIKNKRHTERVKAREAMKGKIRARD